MVYIERTVLVYIWRTLCHRLLWQLKLHLTKRQHFFHWLGASCYKYFARNQYLYGTYQTHCNLCTHCINQISFGWIQLNVRQGVLTLGCTDVKDANSFWKFTSIAQITTSRLPQYLENLEYLEILEKQTFPRFH